jgi:amidase
VTHGSELAWLDATAQAELVRRGEASPKELVEAAIDRIEALNPRLDAVVRTRFDEARAEAAGELPAGPFRGVPLLLKDLGATIAGEPTAFGIGPMADARMPVTSYLAEHFRAAGFVVVGRTSVPEFGTTVTTEPRSFPAARNPWNPEHSTGGSSGGSAAAVASGMVPVAHGNDGGGSIRIPAACCGLVGLKPARGRVSVGPDVGQSFLVVDGVLTRSVGDTATILDVLAGYEPGDATWAPPPAAPYAEAAQQAPGRLRVGLALASPLEGAEVDPVCEQAARDAAALIESLGHEVEEITPPWANSDLLPDFTRSFGPEVSFVTWLGGMLAGREVVPADVEPLTWSLYEHARELDVVTRMASQAKLEGFARAIIGATARFDVIVTPALAQRPLEIGEVHGRGPEPWEHFRRSGHFTPFTAILNITGQPGISLPLYHGEDGLPTGVQLIGPPAGEDVLLRLAAQLEQAVPWAERRPDLAHA